MNVPKLAEELQICPRTVHRDLDALELAGIPYHFDREIGGYRIRQDFFLPPVNLTLAEALALSVMSEQIGKLGQVPMLQQAWQAMIKIRCQLPDALRDEMVKSDNSFVVRTAAHAANPGSTDRLLLINNAIANRRKLRIVYEPVAGEDGGHEQFLLRPYTLYFGQRAWYVIGHSERRGAERTLKLSRIQKIQVTDLPYQIPGGWKLERSFGKAWRMIPEGRVYHVVIEFTGEYARTMADTIWHVTQKVTWRPDGSCLFECDVDGLNEIIWWILSYGPHARVVKPLNLRRAVMELSQKVIVKYCRASQAQIVDSPTGEAAVGGRCL